MLDSASPCAAGADADGAGTSCLLLRRLSFERYETFGVKVEKEPGRLWERFENDTHFISPRSWETRMPLWGRNWTFLKTPGAGSSVQTHKANALSSAWETTGKGPECRHVVSGAQYSPVMHVTVCMATLGRDVSLLGCG